METLGCLCDKLTIIMLKQYHNKNNVVQESLEKQEIQLKNEINTYVANAVSGVIPIDMLSFESNKIYPKEGNEIPQHHVWSIGQTFAELAVVNCNLWHEQEKVYAFENVPVKEKDVVIKRLALLNLQRTQCIDDIDKKFQSMVKGE